MICIMSNFGWLISVAVHFHVVNLHDITMPKGLHFTAVGFFFLFWRLISEVTEQISAKLGHVFTYDCFLKNLVQTSSGIYPMGCCKKTVFLNRLWTLTKHISATEHVINNRNETCRSTGTPLYALQIWWTLVQKWLRTCGEFLPTHPL